MKSIEEETNMSRWELRFVNFEKAYLSLDELKGKSVEEFSTLEKEGIIQRFEILIELCWKVLKNYLKEDGYDNVDNGKKAIRQAFASSLIADGDGWLEALQRRNITSHTYDRVGLDENVNYILSEFYPLSSELYHKLKSCM